MRDRSSPNVLTGRNCLSQSADAPVVGIASLPLPHAQQVAIVALDSQGYLHLYATPLAGRVVVWDPSTDATAEGLHGAALGGTSTSAAVEGRGGAGGSQQEAAQPAAESGGHLLVHMLCEHRPGSQQSRQIYMGIRIWTELCIQYAKHYC